MFWHPEGQYIEDWRTLQNGSWVNGYYRKWQAIFPHKFRNGTIELKVKDYGEGITSVDVYLHTPNWSEHLGHYGTDHLGKLEIFSRATLNKYVIYRKSKFNKGKTSMANKLLSVLRLNKNQRALAKAGVYDENGNLTDDGQELLLNLLAQKHEQELVDLTKDMEKAKKTEEDK